MGIKRDTEGGIYHLQIDFKCYEYEVLFQTLTLQKVVGDAGTNSVSIMEQTKNRLAVDFKKI